MGERTHRNRNLEALPSAPVASVDPGQKKPAQSQVRPEADKLNIQAGDENKESRQQRIENIKRALANGSYHVNSSDVADRLIKHMLQR
jgi:flagellar biosynthesis anti-sigma factor FlgM